MLILAAAYAIPPLCAPTLRKRLAASISEQLNLPVRIGDLKLSWFDSAQMRDISVFSRQDAARPLVHVQQARTEMTLITMLLDRSLGHVDVENVLVHATLGQDGRLELPGTARSQTVPANPGRVDLGRIVREIVVRGVRLELDKSGSPFELALNIQQLQYVGGRLGIDGRLSLSGVLEQGGPRSPVSAMPAADEPDRFDLSGDLAIEAQYDPARQSDVPSLSLKFDKLQGTLGRQDVLLHGEVDIKDISLGRSLQRIGQIHTDALEFRVGANHGWVIAHVSGLPEKVQGSAELLAESINDRQLMDWVNSLSTKACAGGSPARPPAACQTPQEIEQLIATIKPFLLGSKFSATATIAQLTTYDMSIRETYTVGQVEAQVDIDSGRIVAEYAAGLNGGSIRTRYDVNLAEASPLVLVDSQTNDVIACPEIMPQLGRDFPGNTFSGMLNRSENIHIDLGAFIRQILQGRRALVQAGTARTITTDGVVEGKSAPDFVTNIFPGLNLTRYYYKKMTSFTTYKDGVASNDMVFSGNRYNVYMEGTTDADSIGRYEIGLILLGGPQSARFNHIYKSGRIPLFKFKARIDNGKLYDVEVAYLWPHEAAFVMFLKNNLFYRMWVRDSRNKPHPDNIQ